MDLLVITTAIVMVMITPLNMAVFPDALPHLQEKVEREFLIVVVAVVMAITTFITITTVASQPTPWQRIAVHCSAVTDPLVMTVAVCNTIVAFLYEPRLRVVFWNGQIFPLFAPLFMTNIIMNIAIAIAMHITMYALL